MNYRSIASLNRRITQWMGILPRDITVVVGIPRSGLLAANILALHRNVPLTDIERLIEGKLIQTGERSTAIQSSSLSTPQTVLVVDDSIASGNQMKKIREKLGAAKLPHKIYFAAVYALPGSERLVDFFAEIIPSPRVFEWNVMHHNDLSEFCVDIDGVLCVDPTDSENDDGENYKNFLRSAAPLTIPTKPVGTLVTCRLEKYRDLTEEWLKCQGVRYAALHMLNLPDKRARIESDCHAKYKARVYKEIGAPLFIESSLAQAVDIARYSGPQVLCTETGELINPDRANEMLQNAISLPKKIRRKLPKTLRTRIKAWVGRK